MRSYVYFIIFLIFGTVSSQQKTANDDALGTLFQLRNIKSDAENSGANDGSYIGSYLLFEDWNKSCRIQILGKKYALNSVNFNVENNEFMYKGGDEGIFTIAAKNIDFIEIDNKIYKYHLFNNETRFFEILFEANNKLSFYKGYKIRVIPKSELGMLNRPYDEIKKDEKFYFLNNGELVIYKMKKKEFLKFIKKDKQAAILKFIKENSLSYKKEKDIIQILKYYDEI